MSDYTAQDARRLLVVDDRYGYTTLSAVDCRGILVYIESLEAATPTTDAPTITDDAVVIPTIKEAAMKPSPFTTVTDDAVREHIKESMHLINSKFGYDETRGLEACYFIENTLMAALADRERLARDLEIAHLACESLSKQRGRAEVENARLQDDVKYLRIDLRQAEGVAKRLDRDLHDPAFIRVPRWELEAEAYRAAFVCTPRMELARDLLREQGGTDQPKPSVCPTCNWNFRAGSTYPSWAKCPSPCHGTGEASGGGAE